MTDCCDCCTKTVTRRSSYVVFVLAIALLAVGMFIPPFIHNKIEAGINDQITLTPSAQSSNTDAYRVWADNTYSDAVPYYWNAYVFNCTNSREVVSVPGTKPNLTEIGPFVYRKYTKRLNATFGVDQLSRQTVSYYLWEYYVFQPDLSYPLVDTAVNITTLRMPFQVLKSNPMSMLYVPSGNFFDLFQTWDDHKRLFDTHNVRDFLFGYNDLEVAIAHDLSGSGPPSYPGVVGNTSTADEARALGLNVQLTGAAPFEQDMRQYVTYNDMDYYRVTLFPPVTTAPYPKHPPPSPLWATTAANRIYGSEGMQFRRHLEQGQSLEAFVSDLSRMMVITNYDNATYEYSGINLLRFKMARWIQLNDTLYPPNAAFYQFGPSGVLNASLCKPGAPEVYFSQPHFLGADPAIANSVTGLSPADPALHETFIDIEPSSGTTMHALKRLQINVLIHNYTYVQPTDTSFPWSFPTQQWLNNVTTAYYPIFWVEEGGSITDALAAKFVKYVYGGRTLAAALLWVGSVVGAVFVLLATTLLLLSFQMKDPQQDDAFDAATEAMN